MTRMVSWSGTEMYVADDRVDEYLAAGCTLAADSAAKAEKAPAEPKKTAPKKTAAKKTTKK